MSLKDSSSLKGATTKKNEKEERQSTKEKEEKGRESDEEEERRQRWNLDFPNQKPSASLTQIPTNPNLPNQNPLARTEPRQCWRQMFHFPPIPSFSSSSFYFMNWICLEVFFSTPSNLGLQVEVEMGLLFRFGSLNLLGYFCLYICWFHLSSEFMDVSLLGYSIELELLHWTRVCWTRDVILLNSLKIVLTNKIVLFCKKKKKKIL